MWASGGFVVLRIYGVLGSITTSNAKRLIWIGVILFLVSVRIQPGVFGGLMVIFVAKIA